MHRVISLAILLLTLVACANTSTVPAHESFDESTGSTVTVVSKPLVFARERTDVAAHARDYATLVGVEIDRSGTFEDLLLLVRWSTVDRRFSPPPAPAEGEMRLMSEGRVVKLTPLDSLPIDVSSTSRLHLPRHVEAVVRAFAVDVDLLRFMAASRSLKLQMPNEQFDQPFDLWEDGRAALGEFVQQTSAP